VLKFLQIITDTKPLAEWKLSNARRPTTRVICDVLACQVRSGNLVNRKKR
jgi:agmatinase